MHTHIRCLVKFAEEGFCAFVHTQCKQQQRHTSPSLGHYASQDGRSSTAELHVQGLLRRVEVG